MTRNNPRADGWRPAGAVEGGPPSEAVSAAPTASDSVVPFRALLAFTLMLLIPPQTYLPVLASLRAALIAAVVAIFTYLFDRFVHRQPLIVFSREIRI